GMTQSMLTSTLERTRSPRQKSLGAPKFTVQRICPQLGFVMEFWSVWRSRVERKVCFGTRRQQKKVRSTRNQFAKSTDWRKINLYSATAALSHIHPRKHHQFLRNKPRRHINSME